MEMVLTILLAALPVLGFMARTDGSQVRHAETRVHPCTDELMVITIDGTLQVTMSSDKAGYLYEQSGALRGDAIALMSGAQFAARADPKAQLRSKAPLDRFEMTDVFHFSGKGVQRGFQGRDNRRVMLDADGKILSIAHDLELLCR